jgi:hypothetical protein
MGVTGNAVMSPANSARPDLYLNWAVATGFGHYQKTGSASSPKPPQDVSFILQTKSNESAAAFLTRIRPLRGPHGVLSSLKVVLGPTAENSRFCTGIIETSQIPALMGQVERLELSSALIPSISTDWRPVSVKPLKEEGSTATTILGIIDDFVGFDAYPLRGKVKRVWQQTYDGADDRKQLRRANAAPKGLYGRELITPTIVGASPLDRSNYPAVQRAYTHGTHVAGLALAAVSSQKKQPPIVAVHLPQSVLKDTSGGGMAKYVLDGIYYILAQLSDQDRAVINISYGTYAGAHDGTSLLEQAMDELLGAYTHRLEIFLPAGNQSESRTHALVSLEETSNPTHTLEWRVLPDDRTPTFLELWVPQGRGCDFDVELISPSGQVSSGKVAWGHFWIGGHNTASINRPTANANSDASDGCLIALASTAATRGVGPFAEHGVWVVRLSLKSGVKALDLQAYIERDDTFGYPQRGRQSHFVDKSGERYGRKPGLPTDKPWNVVQRQGTLNTVATGQLTTSVGAWVGGSVPRKSHYSCEGVYAATPTLLALPYRPQVMAKADDSLVLQGVLSCGAFGVSKFRMNGTSVATPQIAGAAV